MKFYCTKYTLGANGAIVIRDMPYADGDNYVYFKERFFSTQYIVNRDAFFTFEEALANAHKRRDKKISSLKKSITKLERMKFDAIAPLSDSSDEGEAA